MDTPAKLSAHLCKMFRRHDDDVTEKRIVDVLTRFANEVRFDERREAMKRISCVYHEPQWRRRRALEDAIMERPGWTRGGQ